MISSSFLVLLGSVFLHCPGQSAAVRFQQTRKGGKHSPASSSQPKRYSVCVSEGVGDTEMDNLIFPALVPVEMPVGLTHLDSDLCWCDPIVELDEDGEHV